MIAAHIARIFFIIVKIGCGKHPVFISNKPVSFYLGRVEFNLQLYVFCNGEKRSAEFAGAAGGCERQSDQKGRAKLSADGV